MKVALVHQPWSDPTPPVQAGSTAIWIDRTAALLARRGDLDVVVYGKSPSGRFREQRHAGVTYRMVPAGLDPKVARWLRRLHAWRGGQPFFASRHYFAAFTRRVARDAAERGCDVVHLTNFCQMVPVVRRYAPGARILLHMHCEWLAQLDRERTARRVAAADAILACSEFVTASHRRALPEVAARCRTVYNGVDIEAFAGGGRPAAGPPRLIFVGRLSPEKGVHVLLQAFAVVLRRHPDARLDVIGPAAAAPREFMVFAGGDPCVRELFDRYGPSYPRDLRALVAPEHRAQVTFTPHVPHRDLPGLVRRAHVAVVPSIWQEPFGMPVAEAMAAETAVVASRVGGIPEIVDDGVSGVLVAPGDSGALADALLGLLDDPERRERLGRAARARVAERFTWERVAADVAGVYGSEAPSRHPRQ